MPVVAVGAHTYGQIQIMFDHPTVAVSIGSFSSIAADVVYYARANHHTAGVSSYPFHELFHWGTVPTAYCKHDGKLIIGSDVWIGSGVRIMGALTIGTGAVIGAHTVLTKDVPPYAVVCGSPGLVRKFRFTPDIIDRLLASEWWLMSKEALEPFAELLTTPNVDAVTAFLDALDAARREVVAC